MKHSTLMTVLIVAMSIFPAAGCDSTGGSADASDDAQADAGADTGVDAGKDAASDCGCSIDTGNDASGDAGIGGDGSADASADASIDGGPSAFVPDPERIYDDIKVLASAAYEGRAPGTPGGLKTIDFVTKRFQDLGLTAPYTGPSFHQPFAFSGWEQTAPAKLVIGGETLAEGTDYIVFTNSAQASVTAEIIFAGYGLTVPAFDETDFPSCPLDAAGYDDYSEIDVTDKIVLVLRRTPNDDETIMSGCPANPEAITEPEDTLARFDYKAKNAKLHGAKAIIFVQNYKSGPALPDPVGFPEYDELLAAGAFVHRDKVEAKVADLGTWAASIDSNLKPDSRPTGVNATVEIKAAMVKVSTKNVIGVIEGTDQSLKDEIILFGAHMDHLGTGASDEIYYGADDNASGTAVVMELARAAVESGLKPARTIVFAAWNAEELGLLGSCYYVYYDPLYPIDNVKAAFSVDMVGSGNGTGLYLYDATDMDKVWIADLMALAAGSKGLEYSVEIAAPSGASDHACFAEAGAPAVLALSLTWDDHLYYHTPQDTADTINPDDLKSSVELLWAVLVPLAEGRENNYAAVQNRLLKVADPKKAREFMLRLEGSR